MATKFFTPFRRGISSKSRLVKDTEEKKYFSSSGNLIKTVESAAPGPSVSSILQMII